MPKMKTKSSAKKRFKVTANGYVKVQHVGKRHGMIKRTGGFVLRARGMSILSSENAKTVKKYFLPNL